MIMWCHKACWTKLPTVAKMLHKESSLWLPEFNYRTLTLRKMSIFSSLPPIFFTNLQKCIGKPLLCESMTESNEYCMEGKSKQVGFLIWLSLYWPSWIGRGPHILPWPWEWALQVPTVEPQFNSTPIRLLEKNGNNVAKDPSIDSVSHLMAHYITGYRCCSYYLAHRSKIIITAFSKLLSLSFFNTERTSHSYPTSF